ncbi:MAG: penicillin-binding protein 2 [Planctomycetes bacterium]|nr:penicillin-binding protein 2 [Planctomycetota bacterium]
MTSEQSASMIDLSYRRRMAIVGVALVLVFHVCLGRLFSLQVLTGEKYSEIQNRQTKVHEFLPAPRGRIYTSDSMPLALTRLEGKSVYVNPREIRLDEVERVAWVLSNTLSVDAAEVQRKILENRDKYFVWIKRRISLDEENALTKVLQDGIGFKLETMRHYPQAQMAAHIVGFCNEYGGAEGIEARYNESLTGTDGERTLYRDALQNKIVDVDLDQLSPIPGNDIELTVIGAVQAFVEEEMDDLVRKWAPDSVSVIVMDPNTGRILAMCNRPTFDPNSYSTADPDTRRNRAVTDIYEPGSIFKPLVCLSALENGLVGKDTRINCENGNWVARVQGERGSRSVHDVHGHGTLSVEQVISLSSNIGSAKVVLLLGKEKLQGYLTGFGFGRRTGVDLMGEQRGIVPPFETWSELQESISVAFGHGISVTPLQMLNAFNSVANGGRIYRPFIVERIIGPEGATLYEASPVYREVLKPEVAREVMSPILEKVIESGTGTRAKLESFRVAGKTGTADIPGPRGYGNHGVVSSFVAYAPASNPVVSVIVMANHPTRLAFGTSFYGGNVSAPACARILNKTLTFLGVSGDK